MIKIKHIGLLLLLMLCMNINAQVFNEVSSAVGINHIYNQDEYMGGGAVFFDFDNDGWEDIYIVGGKDKDVLYRNNNGSNFEIVLNSGLDITSDYYTTGAVSGDINNDGYRDIFITTWKGENNRGSLKRNLLFINNGDNTFSESGIIAGITEASFTMGASILDYNNDSFLDIYVVNYVETQGATFDTNGNIIFNPTCFKNYLYKNNGDGTFTEKGQTLGIDNIGCALAVMPTDYDQDQDQDIYIANDFGGFVTPNTMYQNNYPNASYTNTSDISEMNVGIYGMGIAVGDIDKDSDFDYYTTNLGRNVLLENNGNQIFTDKTTFANIENMYALDGNGSEFFSTSWGTAFLDVNNDTWPDLFVANGRVPADQSIATGETDPNKLYINNGDNTFSDVSIASGIDDASRGRGMAYCDYDKDGDLDVLVIVQNGGIGVNVKSTLFENQLNPNGLDGKNWIQFDLKGISINRSAIGAIIKLTVDGEELIQEVHGQGSHSSQHSLIIHFGLANNQSVDKVEIIWSSTSSQAFFNIAANSRYAITEGNTLSTNTLSTNILSTNTDFFNKVQIFPNPVKSKLFIRKIKIGSDVLIMTLDGKIIMEETVVSESSSFDLNRLSKGVYLISILNHNQKYNKLFIKQ